MLRAAKCFLFFLERSEARRSAGDWLHRRRRAGENCRRAIRAASFAKTSSAANVAASCDADEPPSRCGNVLRRPAVGARGTIGFQLRCLNGDERVGVRSIDDGPVAGQREVIRRRARKGHHHRLQVPREHLRIRKAIGRILRQQLHDDVFKLFGRIRRVPAHRFWIREPLQLKHLRQILRAKRRPAGQQRVHHAAQAVLVAAQL